MTIEDFKLITTLNIPDKHEKSQIFSKKEIIARTKKKCYYYFEDLNLNQFMYDKYYNEINQKNFYNERNFMKNY